MLTDLNTYPNATFLYPPTQNPINFSSFTIGYNDVIELAWKSTFAKPCLTLYTEQEVNYLASPTLYLILTS